MHVAHQRANCLGQIISEFCTNDFLGHASTSAVCGQRSTHAVERALGWQSGIQS
jgi:hypothetical protein